MKSEEWRVKSEEFATAIGREKWIVKSEKFATAIGREKWKVKSEWEISIKRADQISNLKPIQ